MISCAGDPGYMNYGGNRVDLLYGNRTAVSVRRLEFPGPWSARSACRVLPGQARPPGTGDNSQFRRLGVRSSKGSIPRKQGIS